MTAQITELDIDNLQPNPLQPRGNLTPESVADLVESIRQHGILEPLVIAKTPAGYQIIAGERRWRAAKIVGLKVVPVVVKETNPRGMLEMAIIENVQREDLNPIDRGRAFLRLLEEFGLTNQDIAEKVSKSGSYVSNSLRLLELPDTLKDGLISGLITEGHARALSAIRDQQLLIEAYKILLKESGSVRRAEDLARRMKVRADKKQAKNKNLVSDELDQIIADIHQVFGGENDTKVKISRSRAETRIYLNFKGNLVATEEKFLRVYRSLTGDKKIKVKKTNNQPEGEY